MVEIKLTRRAPTAELIGPKKGKIIAKNQIGITTGNLASALKHMLFVSCIPITFSHTKYNGVQANPKVMNCHSHSNKQNSSINKAFLVFDLSHFYICTIKLYLILKKCYLYNCIYQLRERCISCTK